MGKRESAGDGMNGIQSTLVNVPQGQLTKDDYYTPKFLFDAMDIQFDIDVCSPPGGISWIPANTYYTMKDDGLSQPWDGRVWMNPPFSNPSQWVSKFIEHRNGIALLPYSKSKWFSQLWLEADGIVDTPPRFHFYRLGEKRAISFPLFLAAFGDVCVEAIGRVGTVRVKRNQVMS